MPNNQIKLQGQPSQSPAPTTSSNGVRPGGPKPKPVPLWHAIFGVVLVVGVVGAIAWVFIWQPVHNYVAVVNTYELVREYPTPSALSLQDIQPKLFSPQIERRYIDGEGLNVKVVFKEAGQSDRTEPHLLLEPFKKFDEKPVPERQPEIELAKNKLAQLVNDLNHPPIKVFVFVDNTDDDPKRPDLVGAQYFDYVRQTSKDGNRINLKVHRITGTHFSDPLERDYVPPDKADSRIKEMSQPLGANPGQNTSAIATDVFHDLTEDNRRDPLDKDSRVLLFSDLIENDPQTVSFEFLPLSDIHQLEAALGNPNKREVLKQRLQAVEVCPALNGAKIEVYLPPNNDRLLRMKALFPLWKEIWLEHGAGSVELHY